MKKIFLFFLTAWLAACSSMIPYKNQNLDYLHGIEENPDAYRGKVVSFGGEVKGVTEDARRMRLIIKIDVPFYYYATGKDPLSYELLLISFDKKGMPQMTGLQKGSNVKVLARVANYETRKNLTGKPIAVLHLIAFAVADRDRNKDFFRPEPPLKQLYESWKAGKLFYDEQPQEIEARYPAPQRKTMSFIPLPPAAQTQPEAPSKGIVYDDEEPNFVLPPDPVPPAEEKTEGDHPADTTPDGEEQPGTGPVTQTAPQPQEAPAKPADEAIPEPTENTPAEPAGTPAEAPEDTPATALGETPCVTDETPNALPETAEEPKGTSAAPEERTTPAEETPQTVLPTETTAEPANTPQDSRQSA